MNHYLRRKTEGGFSIMSGIVAGTATAMLLSLIFLLGLTSFTLNGNIEADRMDVPIFFVRAISVLAGTLVSTGIYKEKLLMNIGITASCYLLLIIAVGIAVFDAGLSAFIGGVLSVASGSASACIIRISALKKTPRTGKRRI